MNPGKLLKNGVSVPFATADKRGKDLLNREGAALERGQIAAEPIQSPLHLLIHLDRGCHAGW